MYDLFIILYHNQDIFKYFFVIAYFFCAQSKEGNKESPMIQKLPGAVTRSIARTTLQQIKNPRQRASDFEWNFGAGDGSRTRDPKLGKLVLYQLSYARFRSAL